MINKELLLKLEEYADDKQLSKSRAIEDLIQKGLDSERWVSYLDDIRRMNVTEIGNLKTLEDFDKILSTALDITSVRDPNKHQFLIDFYKNRFNKNNDN